MRSLKEYSHNEPIYREVKDERTGRMVRVGPMLGMQEVDGFGRVISEHFYPKPQPASLPVSVRKSA